MRIKRGNITEVRGVMVMASEQFLASFTAKQLIDHAMARRDPEAAASLYMLTSYKEPMFVAAWKEQALAAQQAVGDLADVMEWLRADKLFAQSDRVRTIAGRLARSVPSCPAFGSMDGANTYQNLARDWPNQLTAKESAKIIAEAEAEKAKARAALAEIEKGVV